MIGLLMNPAAPAARARSRAPISSAETMTSGEVLAALLCREPVFLFPELAKRGHCWRGAFEPDGKTYRVLIRIGTTQGATA